MFDFVFDTSRWPLVRTRVVGTPEEEDVKRFTEAIDSLYDRGERFANVVDARELASFPPKQRLAYGQFLKDGYDKHKRYTVAVATIVSSPLIRGALTAVSWLQRWPHPFKACATTEEAISYATTLLQREGLHIPPPQESERAAL